MMRQKARQRAEKRKGKQERSRSTSTVGQIGMFTATQGVRLPFNRFFNSLFQSYRRNVYIYNGLFATSRHQKTSAKLQFKFDSKAIYIYVYRSIY